MFSLSVLNACSAIVYVTLLIINAEAKPPMRIQGGKRAIIEDFPWQASVWMPHFICGGTILDSRYVITAAHCVYDYKGGLDNVTIGIGNTVLNDTDKYQIESILVHPGFSDKFPYPNDIAIIKLMTEINFDAKKRAIALPESDVPVHAKVTTSGWGANAWGILSKYLSKLDLKIISNTDCDPIKINLNDLDFYMDDAPLTSGQICGLPGKHAGICEGDSGGALVYNGSIVGISSWKYECGEGYPNVFTRIYEYVDWIRGNMKL